MNCKYMTLRSNSKGILYTDESEYLKAHEKSWREETKRVTENIKKKRGRPKKNIQKGITFTHGEYILDFS